MTQATAQLKSQRTEIRAATYSWVGLAAVVFIYLVFWVFTRGHFMADTVVYTQAILRHQFGGENGDYHSLTSNPFWDFGHILWRPFGWFCFLVTDLGARVIHYQNPRAEVLHALFGINFVFSLACVILFFSLARRVIADEWSAVLASIGFFSADSFLNYAHSGNAYNVGLACLVAGMYLSWPETTEEKFSGRAIGAGVLYALAVLFWFPYLFVLPAAMAGPLVLYGYNKRQWRFVSQTVVACAVVGIGIYGSAMAIVGIRNFADLKAWIFSSGHGHIQPGGFRAVARLAFSVPRSFVNMDRDGMWLKRYLVHDPYAPVSVQRLFGLSLWKLALFYAAASVVGLEMFRSKQGRFLLLLLSLAVLPILIFAVFLFEAGSIERYLPLYPFVFLSIGYVLSAQHVKRGSKGLLLGCALAALVIVNISAMRVGAVESRKSEAVARIHDLAPLLGRNDLVLAVNEQDSLAELRQDFPLDSFNLNSEWQTYDVLEVNTERLATWREDLAKRVLRTWRRGGAVWVPRRFLSSTPKPDWNWVEGDDKRIHWADLPAFFSKFETGPMVGGEDGFVLLEPSPKNGEIIDFVARLTPSYK